MNHAVILNLYVMALRQNSQKKGAPSWEPDNNVNIHPNSSEKLQNAHLWVGNQSENENHNNDDNNNCAVTCH
jgi:hypothetical protein